MKPVLLILLLWSFTIPAGEPLIKSGDKILFVGNSLTELGGGMDNRVKEALAAGGVSVITEKYIDWARELDTIFKDGHASAKINTGSYNVVVLQGWLHAEDYSNDRSITDPKGAFFDAVMKFDALVRQKGGRTVLYMTFAGKFQNANFNLVSDKIAVNYDTAAVRIGNAPVAPCGLAWKSIWNSPPAGKSRDFMFVDEIHPNDFGQRLNSYVFYMVLTGKSPVGLKVTTPGLDAATDTELQKRAETVTTQWMASHKQQTIVRADRPFRPFRVRADAPTMLINGRKSDGGTGTGSYKNEASAVMVNPAASHGILIIR